MFFFLSIFFFLFFPSALFRGSLQCASSLWSWAVVEPLPNRLFCHSVLYEKQLSLLFCCRNYHIAACSLIQEVESWFHLSHVDIRHPKRTLRVAGYFLGSMNIAQICAAMLVQLYCNHIVFSFTAETYISRKLCCYVVVKFVDLIVYPYFAFLCVHIFKITAS